MFPLAAAPQALGEILLQGLTLGRLLFRQLFMLTSLWMFLGLIPVIFLAWQARDIPVSPMVQFQALRGSYGLAVLVSIVTQLFVVTLILQRVAGATRAEPTGQQGEVGKAVRLLPWVVIAMCTYYAAVVLGLVLLLVPGIILGVSLAFTPFAVVLDDQKPIQALNCSHNLVWGQWWRTLGLFLALFFPLVMAATLLAGVLGIDVFSAQGDFPTGRTLLEESVVSMVLESLFWPFGLSVLCLYYHDLKLRKQLAI